MLTQTYTAPDHSYSLEYPRTWDMETYENIPAFFDPISGKGAMQIISMDLQDGEELKAMEESFPYLKGETILDKMILFLYLQNIECSPEELKVYNQEETDFIPHEYYVNEHFYMAVMMQKLNTFLLILYNSKTQPDEEEALVISNIIKTIQINPKGNDYVQQ